MTMKNNAKFEEELTFHFKTDMRNLTNFDSSTRKSKKIALWLAPLTKVYNVWAKRGTGELCLIALKIDAKYKGKVTCAIKNDIWQICIGWNKWIANLTKLFTYLFTSLLFLDLRYT